MGQRIEKMTSVMFWLGFYLLLTVTPIVAQDYPTKSINMIVALGTGSPQDVITRVLVKKAEKTLGQPFVVTNNGTGGGSVALGIVAKEKPDGYHLVCNGTPMLIMVPQVRPVAYKLSDFTPFMQFGDSQYGLAERRFFTNFTGEGGE